MVAITILTKSKSYTSLAKQNPVKTVTSPQHIPSIASFSENSGFGTVKNILKAVKKPFVSAFESIKSAINLQSSNKVEPYLNKNFNEIISGLAKEGKAKGKDYNVLFEGPQIVLEEFSRDGVMAKTTRFGQDLEVKHITNHYSKPGISKENLFLSERGTLMDVSA